MARRHSSGVSVASECRRLRLSVVVGRRYTSVHTVLIVQRWNRRDKRVPGTK